MGKIFVFDTNTLISASLLKNSPTSLAIEKAISIGKVAMSSKSMVELSTVIFRKKFDRYFISNEERLDIIYKIAKNTIFFDPDVSITDCRDDKDNLILELAVVSKASCIVTGDNDLLVLHPFRGIPILQASDFLKQF